MIPRLTFVETLIDPGLSPSPVPLAAGIGQHDIAVAGGSQRCVEPCDLVFQMAPFRVSRHRREKAYGGAEPRERDTYLMHGLGVAGACAAVMRLDPDDTIARDLLKCHRAIEVGWDRGGLRPAGCLGRIGTLHLPVRSALRKGQCNCSRGRKIDPRQ